MIQEVIQREVPYQVKAPGWAPVWHRAHNNFLYHTDEEPNNELIILLTLIPGPNHPDPTNFMPYGTMRLFSNNIFEG